MSRHSESRNALRSFLPASYIARNENERDAYTSLFYKYQAQRSRIVSDRMAILAAALVGIEYEPLERAKAIEFDGFCLETNVPFPMTGSDSERGVEIEKGSTDALLLHVDSATGHHDALRQFGYAAAYIRLHTATRETPYVVGITYSEMARIGSLLGMREMAITSLDKTVEASIQADYTRTFKGPNRRAFAPAAVYLPTDEFVKRFYK